MRVLQAKRTRLTDGKRVKNLKEAKINVWLGLILVTGSGLILCCELREWQNTPNLLNAFHLTTDCGLLLTGVFLRADAKEVLRRGGESYTSWGWLVSTVLMLIGQWGRTICKHGLPPPLILWFLATSLSVVFVCLLIILYLRIVMPKWESQFKSASNRPEAS